MMNCVKKYCSWSGQSVNRDKSGLFVSKGVHKQFVHQVKTQWGINLLSKGLEYLGMHLFISSNKTKDFTFVKEKLKARISGWKSRCLSRMRRTSLIKVVAQSTMLYGMASLKFLKGLCDKMDSMVRKFWWNPNKSGNKIYTLVAWTELRKPLSDEGLGFRSFERFNEAIVAKLAWWVLPKRDSFYVTVLQAKHKVENNWLQARLAKSASFSWRGIEGVRSLISKGACKLVGSSEDILVWGDPWIPNCPSFMPSPREVVENPQCITIAQLMVHDKSKWDEAILNSLFDEPTIVAINNIPRWSKDHKDLWIWKFSDSSSFLVKSAYKVVSYDETPVLNSHVLGKIWKSSLHARLKMLL